MQLWWKTYVESTYVGESCNVGMILTYSVTFVVRFNDKRYDELVFYSSNMLIIALKAP